MAPQVVRPSADTVMTQVTLDVPGLWSNNELITLQFLSLTGSDNGLLPKWHQAIAQTNDVFVQNHWDPIKIDIFNC